MTTSAGVNHIDLSECCVRGIAIANAGNVFSADCADYAVELLIDVLRKISASDRYVRNGNWATLGDFDLSSKVMFSLQFFCLFLRNKIDICFKKVINLMVEESFCRLFLLK